jgi:hypothetical protein
MLIQRLTLPDDRDAPVRGAQCPYGCSIATNVSGEFGEPEFPI